MKEKGLIIQYKIIQNMLKYLEYKVPTTNKSQRMKSYVAYLAERTTLKSKRIRRILDDDINKSIEFSECLQIARALEVDIPTLFTIDD